MIEPLPPWPQRPPSHGPVVLRRFETADAPMALALSQDPYVPLTGSLPANATAGEAVAWIERQQGRHGEGRGFSFAIAEATTGRAVGQMGLWFRGSGADGATVGYGIAPPERGHGFAAAALRAATSFGWTVPALPGIDAFIEPWNLASIRTAERAGFVRVAVLRRHYLIGGIRRDMLRFSCTRPPAG